MKCWSNIQVFLLLEMYRLRLIEEIQLLSRPAGRGQVRCFATLLSQIHNPSTCSAPKAASPATTQHSRCAHAHCTVRKQLLLLTSRNIVPAAFNLSLQPQELPAHFASPPSCRGFSAASRCKKSVTPPHPTAHTLPGSMPRSARYRDLCL